MRHPKLNICTAGILFFTLFLCSTSGADEEISLINMEVGPVVQFEQKCARCHGPYGTFYGEDFANLHPEELKDVVWEMMVGPAGMDPSEAEVDAMTEYHKALHHKKPFATLNNALAFQVGESSILEGDTLPDSKVLIQKNGETYSAEVKKETWSLQDPPTPPFTIAIQREEEKVSFSFPKQQWVIIQSATSEQKHEE